MDQAEQERYLPPLAKLVFLEVDEDFVSFGFQVER